MKFFGYDLVKQQNGDTKKPQTAGVTATVASLLTVFKQVADQLSAIKAARTKEVAEIDGQMTLLTSQKLFAANEAGLAQEVAEKLGAVAEAIQPKTK